jgi:glycosyltransferase involved in cell wall biosynthesis
MKPPMPDATLPTIWFNMTTSAGWDRPPVGIVRVELELCAALSALLGPQRLRECVWQSDQFVARTASDGSTPGPVAGDILLTMGLDWDQPYPSRFYALSQEQGLRIITCCYDLIPILFPQYCVGDVALRFKEYLNLQIWGSAAVLCISENTRRDFVSHCARIGAPLRPTQVIALGDTLPAADGHISAAVRELLAQPFLMYVSTIERRKNHEVLYHALRLLCQSGRRNQLPRIVFVGMQGWHVGDLLHDIANDPLTQGLIVQLHDVNDAELHMLYSQAKFCLYPSIYEGWGLPVGEALALGKAVLASDQASLPEVGGDLVRYLSPWNAQAWADAITEWLTKPDIVVALEQRVAREYRVRSWRDTAQSVLQLIEQLASATPPHPVMENPVVLEADPAPMPEGERQLFVDVSELIKSDSRSGIQRVVRSILVELLANPPAGFRVEPVFVGADHGYCYARQFNGQSAAVRSYPTDDFLLPRRGDMFLGLDLLPYMATQCADYYAMLRQIGVDVYFVAYDLLSISMPQFFSSEAKAIFVNWLNTVAQADGIIAISRAVADEIQERLAQRSPDQIVPRVRPLKLGWFHLGADIEASLPSSGMPANADAVLAVLAERPTFVMVGTIEPRKGHRQTLEAFERLWDQGMEVNLVIVGKKGWRSDAVCQTLARNQERDHLLFWLDGVSDEYLDKVYSHADCLIFASEGEGFGLPLIEAARHNLPIIARDLPVFREVAGRHASYFSGLDPDDIATCVVEWLAQDAAGQAPQSGQIAWLSWQQSAAQLKKVILEGDWYHE